MHRTAPLAIALAIVGILVATTLVPTGHATHLATTTPAQLRPAATDSILPVNYYGAISTAFWVGQPTGIVYFRAFDPSGDATAVVAINDLNASNDSLANPVAKWTVRFNGGNTNSSYLTSNFLLIPLNLRFGGTWNITISAASAGFSSTKFQVHTYYVSATRDTSAYLPGHSGFILYSVNSSATHGPVSVANQISVLATYTNNAGATVALTGFPKNFAAHPQGQFNFTVPTDARQISTISFLIYANVTTPAESETTTMFAPVATVSGPSVYLSSCPSGCGGTTFQTGTAVYVIVSAYLVWFNGTAPAGGLTVAFSFTSGATPVTPGGGWPKNLTSNTSGGAAILFLATIATFPSGQPAAVTVTLTDSIDTALHLVSPPIGFNVVTIPPGNALFQVALDSSQYFGGDTATGSWQLGGLNSSASGGWVVSAWSVWELSTGTLVKFQNVTGSAGQGSAQFSIPLNYGGGIRFTVSAHNQTQSITDSTTATVSGPVILLNPSESTFLPGDTVTVTVATQGQIFASAQLWQNVVDSSGNTLVSGALSGSKITFSVPRVGAPSSVTVSVAAQTPTAGVVARASLGISQTLGYSAQAGVQTKSNYIDDSYQPGQTVTIHYVVTALGAAVLPKTYFVYVFPGSSLFTFSGYSSVLAETTSPSGDVQYTIPSGTPGGAQSFTVYIFFGAGCPGVCFAATTFSILVEPNPSPLGYQIGAGSGLSVGWLILFLLLLLVAIVGLIWHRRRTRPMVMRPESGHSVRSPDPGWRESPGGGAPPSPPPPLPPSSGG